MRQDRATIVPPGSASVSAALERVVAPLLTELRSQPFVRRILEGRVTKEQYAGLLQSLLTLQRSLARAVTDARHLNGFDGPAFRREEALARDLRVLRSHLPVRGSESLDQFESEVRAWSRPPSVALVGALFAVELERKHWLKLVRPLADALQLRVAPHHGLDYHLEGADRASRRVRGLADWIDRNVLSSERRQELVDGASGTLRALIALHRTAESTK